MNEEKPKWEPVIDKRQEDLLASIKQPSTVSLSFREAIKTCFIKYRNDDGRASKSEFWYWCFFAVIASYAVTVLFEISGFFVLVLFRSDRCDSKKSFGQVI